MSTAIANLIAFRCKTCWQNNYALVEEAGSETDCEHCGSPVQVPDETEAKIISSEEVEESLVATPQKVPVPDLDRLTESELYQLARDESLLPLNQMDFQGYPLASLMSRFVAKIIDGVLLIFASVAGAFALFWAAQNGLLPQLGPSGQSTLGLAHWAVLGFAPLLLNVIQWNLIATRGQSIGKFCVCIRIVSVNGKLPGFLLGVVVREWVRFLLCMIPLFGLFDILLILTEPKRCIHDYLAATRVVTA